MVRGFQRNLRANRRDASRRRTDCGRRHNERKDAGIGQPKRLARTLERRDQSFYSAALRIPRGGLPADQLSSAPLDPAGPGRRVCGTRLEPPGVSSGNPGAVSLLQLWGFNADPLIGYVGDMIRGRLAIGLLATLVVAYVALIHSPLRFAGDSPVYLCDATDLATGRGFHDDHLPPGYPRVLAALEFVGLR